MIDSRVIQDYTYLWYDVRPHPNFGTVEVRVMDSQTRVEHTLALAALVQAMVKELAEHYDAGKQALPLPVRDARREQVAGRPPRARGRAGGPAGDRAACRRELARRLLDRLRAARRGPRLRGGARGLEDILDNGNGAPRQLVVYEANHDLHEVVKEIVEATVPEAAETPGD